MAKQTIDRGRLLSLLKPVKYEGSDEAPDESMEQLDVADSISRLAGLKSDSEYKLCRDVAKHVLGEVPEPDDDYLGED